MTLYEFNNLPLNDQCQTIWQEGVYLAAREFEGHRINLYHLKEFYAEVWYNLVSNEIVRTNSFKSKEALEPYVELIKLDNL